MGGGGRYPYPQVCLVTSWWLVGSTIRLESEHSRRCHRKFCYRLPCWIIEYRKRALTTSIHSKPPPTEKRHHTAAGSHGYPFLLVVCAYSLSCRRDGISAVAETCIFKIHHYTEAKNACKSTKPLFEHHRAVEYLPPVSSRSQSPPTEKSIDAS
ncbi:hypothetical protein ARMGADRAFT_41408 [Armillaria gallica]|uniref:Uncharacterized protein n=1 Tax=Armillaria gallica TaxID=47427 RepID=A0A2H3ENA4_ARMGA|nr:hypothetical protein ARMGADRAFT_41408 [Armillaria gallica]